MSLQPLVSLALAASVCTFAARAQEIEVLDMPGFALPCATAVAVMQDQGGTLWLACGASDTGHRTSYFHDGERWVAFEPSTPQAHASTSEVRLRTLVGGAAGGVFARSDDEVFSLGYSAESGVARTSLGKLPHTKGPLDFVLTAAGGVVYVEVDGTVLRCVGGRCTTLAEGDAQVLLATQTGVVVKDPNGATYLLADVRRALDRLPAGPVTQRATGNGTPLAFVLGDSIYTVREGVGSVRARAVCAVPGPGVLGVLGERLLWSEPGAPVLVRDGEGKGRWEQLRYGSPGAGARPRPTFAGRAAGGLSGEQRAILLSANGLLTAERRPYRQIAVDLEAGAALRVAVGEGAVAVASHRSIAILGRRGPRIGAEVQRFEAAEQLMRHSTPSAMCFYNDDLIVATSDARLLALRYGRPVRALPGLERAGGYIFDLERIGLDLWGCFDPTGYPNAGVFRYSPDAGMRVYSAADGLARRGLSVRRSPEGGVYASAKGGAYLAYRYRPMQDDWVGIAPAPPDLHERAGFEVHELAAVSDTLLYLATAQGLLRWSPTAGVTEVALPRNISGQEVRAVTALARGLCFSVLDRGVYILDQGEICAIDDPGAWPNATFAYRGIDALGEQHALVTDGDALTRVEVDWRERAQLKLTVALSTEANPSALVRSASEGDVYDISLGDTLFIRYSLPGFSTAELHASFSVNGAPLAPDRERAGRAAFASLREGAYPIDVRVVPSRRNYAAVVQRAVVHVSGPWYASTRGVGAAALAVIGAVCLLAYGYSLRQRQRARTLEAVVELRTADLQVARHQAERASEAKTMFLANMSHELRTPLNAVLGMAGLLEGSTLEDEQREQLRAIQRAGGALHRIVGDVLEFAEVDEGTVRRHDEETDLRELLDELAFTYAERAADKRLFFGSKLDCPPRLTLDGPKVRSIIGHLLGNAIKFTASGAVDLRVRYIGSTLHVEVEDTGCGVPAAFRPHLFEVFQQGDNSATRQYGGTGLGLAIVQTYTSCLGGAVRFDPTATGGSLFSVSLPVAAPVAQPGTPVGHGASPKLGAVLVGYRPAATRQLRREFARAGLTEVSAEYRGSGGSAGRAVVVLVDSPQEVADFRRRWRHRNGPLPQNVGSVIYVAYPRVLAAVALGEGEVGLAYPLAPGSLRTACTPAPASPTPAAPQEEPDAAPALASPFFDLAATHPLRILVAEDNPMNKLLALSVLRKLGYAADHAVNGAVACARQGEEPYDLILMDVHMPELDGLQATRRIRVDHADEPPYICALTANASERGREECLAAGMDTFLTKPMDVQRLIQVLRSVPPLGTRSGSGDAAGHAARAVEREASARVSVGEG